jgi:hypothetical protein
MNIKLVSFFALAVVSCVAVANEKCSPGAGITICYPSDYQNMIDPKMEFKNNLFKSYDEKDRQELSDEKHIDISDLKKDLELSKTWNNVLNEVGNYYFDKENNLIKDIAGNAFVQVDILNNEKAKVSFNRDNFVKWLVETIKQSNVPEKIKLELERKVNTASDREIDYEMKKITSQMEQFKSEELMRRFSYSFLNLVYFRDALREFYLNNSKIAFILPDSIPNNSVVKIPSTPFGIESGNVFIPEAILKNTSKEELHTILVHEAFHFFKKYSQAIGSMQIFLDKNEGLSNVITETFSKEIKEKHEEKHVNKNMSFFNNILFRIAESDCFTSFKNEVQIDQEVVFYLDKEKTILYRNVLDKLINEKADESEKVRIKLINVLIDYLEKYDGSNFSKEVAYQEMRWLMSPKKQNSITIDENIPYRYLTNENERVFFEKYNKTIYEDKPFIEKLKNTLSSKCSQF